MTKDQYEYIARVIGRLANKAPSLFPDDPNWQGRTGSYLCVTGARLGLPIYQPALIGIVSPEKSDRYFSLSQEKPRRLSQHPEHLSSWQSRNPDADQYGGAIKMGDKNFSLSGYPELGDEALSLIGGEVYCEFLLFAVERAKEIVRLSNNPYWAKLRSHLRNFL